MALDQDKSSHGVDTPQLSFHCAQAEEACQEREELWAWKKKLTTGRLNKLAGARLRERPSHNSHFQEEVNGREIKAP